MSIEDPWGAAPAEPEQPPAPAAPVAAQSASPVIAATVPGEAGLSVTFKGDGGYSNPWIVPKYSGVAEALVDFGMDPQHVASLSKNEQWKALFEWSQKMNAHFASLSAGKPAAPANGGGGQQQQQSRAPQQAQEAPGGEKRFCQHGEMQFKSGVSKKSGKPYQLFSCTAPRDQQCEAQFLNRK